MLYWLHFIPAFLGSWALQEIFGITVRNPLTVVLFVCLLWGYNHFGGFKWWKAAGSLVLSFVATYFSYKKVSAPYNSSIFRILSVVILALGLWAVYYLALCLIFNSAGLEKRKKMSLSLPEEKAAFSGKKAFFIIAVIILVCWTPYFLYEFPGIMTADSLVQYGQIMGVEPVSNHHPILHTLLIEFFYKLGLLFTGSEEIAIAFYTVFQMIFMSLCCSLLTLHIESRRWQILTVLFFAVVPFNAVFAMTIWKDIIFAGITMILFCLVVDMRKKEKNTLLSWAEFTFIGLLFTLLRSNAWYAFIVWIPFLLFAFKKDVKKAVISVFAVVALVLVIKGPVMTWVGVAQPDFVESLSVPLQQVARSMVEEVEFSDEDTALIENVIDTTYVKELYAFDFADNIKELARAGHPEIIEDNKADYFKLWTRIVSKHPLIAVRAWYDLVGGYIYPDVPVRVGEIDGIMGNEFGLYWNPIIGGPVVVKTREIMLKLGDFVPLYGMLFSIGAYTWLLVFAIVISLRRKGPVLCKLLLLFQVGTLLIASPVVDFRYGYGVVMTMPLWLYYSIVALTKRQDGIVTDGTDN